MIDVTTTILILRELQLSSGLPAIDTSTSSAPIRKLPELPANTSAEMTQDPNSSLMVFYSIKIADLLAVGSRSIFSICNRKGNVCIHVGSSCVSDTFSDSIYGLPKILRDSQLSCTFALFEGAETKRDLEFATARCELDLKGIIARLKATCNLRNVLPIKTTRIILEFRAQEPQARDFRDVLLIGWTSFDLFNDKFQPDYGNW